MGVQLTWHSDVMADLLDRELDAYLAHLRVERGLSMNTLTNYGRDLARYLEHLRSCGIARPGQVTLEHAQRFGAKLVRGGPGRPALAPSSVSRMLAAVRGLHRFWVSEAVVPEDVTADLDTPRIGRRLPKALTVEEVTRLIAAAGGEPGTARSAVHLRDGALIELLYGTGARISEVVALDVDDLTRALADPAAGLRLIGKGDKERLVPLGQYARAAVEAWLVQGRSSLASRGTGTAALLLNERGGRLSRQNAFNRVRAAAERAAIETEVSPHTLRHSYATHLLDGGADVRVVQELLGHASVTTTQIYTLVTVDHVRAVYLAAHPRSRD